MQQSPVTPMEQRPDAPVRTRLLAFGRALVLTSVVVCLCLFAMLVLLYCAEAPRHARSAVPRQSPQR